ncbi:MAG: recombination protein O N-terminal domain-containing protein [Bacteroidetes bacterium]|nr:recombination protein O N-terminal domain-containing protein [Bacteroidota bacterium]
MLQTTRAVALRTFRHGDHTTVLKAYTEQFGLRSYMVRTGPRSAVKPMHLQPLARLELVVTEDRERDLHAVREARILLPYTGVASDPRRGMLLLFAQEVFYRTLREGVQDPALFAFVMNTLEAINGGPELGRIPLDLLVGLSHHLGFLPEPPLPGQDRFDLREGRFFHGAPDHAFCMDHASSAAFAGLLHGKHGTAASIPAAGRTALLGHLLMYFRLHVEGFGDLRSPEVLHALLH